MRTGVITTIVFLFLVLTVNSVEAQSKQNLNNPSLNVDEESNLPQDRSRQMTLYQITTNTRSLMSYIGHLADAAGNPITTSISIIFSIYASVSGGTALWSETHNITPATTGTFGVALGSITSIPSSLFKDNSTLYLGIKVANDVEMSPRQMITSAAFAFSAEVASLREGYGAPVSIGTANASGTAITLARSDHVHQGVHSLAKSGSSLLYGDVTLSAGVNATLTQVGQNLEFSVPSAAFARIGKVGSPTLTGDVTLDAEANEINLSQSDSTITIGIVDPLIVTKGGTGISTQFTQGSVVFAGASGVYSQNNSQLFWDNTNNRLGIGTANPGSRLTTRYDTAPVDNDGANTLRLERGDASYNAGDPGSQIVFAQRWWAGDNNIIRTGGIRGIKTADSAFFGGGLQLLYQPNSSGGDMLVGVTLSGSGRVGIGLSPTANKLEVGGDASKTTAGDWLANSDLSIKQNIHDLTHALEVVMAIRPVGFNYTDKYVAEHPSIDPDKVYYNFIAQEFQQVFPAFVQKDPVSGLLQVDTYPAQVYAIAAVRELNQVVQKQQKIMEAQQKQIESLQAEIKAIRESLSSASEVVGLRKY